MTKSGGGTICINVPPLQILGGLVPLSPVIYAHAWAPQSLPLIIILIEFNVKFYTRIQKPENKQKDKQLVADIF